MTVLGLAAATAVLLVLAAGAASAGKPKPPPPPPPVANPAIAYALTPWTGDCQIRVMNADGSNDRLVATEANNGEYIPVDWSPDRAWVVWAVPTFPGFRIAKARPDGSGYTVLLAEEAYEPGSNYGYEYGYPRWSPGDVLGKGEKIAFGAHGLYDGVLTTHLFLMDTAGGNVVDLTDVSGAPELVLPGNLAWSPGADRIAGVQEDGHLVVFQLGLIDGEIRIVETFDVTQDAWDTSNPDYLSGDPIGLGPMDWSNTPLSSRLVVRYCDPDPYDPVGEEVYVLELEPPYGMTMLTTTSDDAHHTIGGVAWSPDDTRVAVTFPMGYQKWAKLAGIWILDPQNGRNRAQLLSGPASWVEWWAGAE